VGNRWGWIQRKARLGGDPLHRRALFVLVACAGVLPAVAFRSFDRRVYLPEVLDHIERARSLDASQAELASAHAKVILHDEGLKVFVDYSQVPSGQLADCQSAVNDAIQYWNGVVGPNALTVQDSAAGSDVRLDFRPDVRLNGIQVGGYCSQSWGVSSSGTDGASHSYNASISARLAWPGGRAMSRDYLRNIVTHEFGHVYGLNDSPDAGRLMSPLSATKPRFDLDTDEAEALKEIRLTAFSLERDTEARAKRN